MSMVQAMGEETLDTGVMDSRRAPSVEETNPSPKHIGREFVRQYYTMLASQPRFVHRFYSHDSTFIHGDADTVKGQSDIQRAIEAMEIGQCSAKILKVDAAETLGHGVVIQVIGLLNVNSKGYARFMQTFVLAPQSHKNYYVYNDIFRYESEVAGGEAAESVREEAAVGNNYQPEGSELESQPAFARLNGSAKTAGTNGHPPPAPDHLPRPAAKEVMRASPPEVDQAMVKKPWPVTPKSLLETNIPMPQSLAGGKDPNWSGRHHGQNVGVAAPLPPRDSSRRESSEAVIEPAAVPQPPSDPSPAPVPAPAAPVQHQAHPPTPAQPTPTPPVVADKTPKTWATVTKKNTAAAAAPPPVPVQAPSVAQPEAPIATASPKEDTAEEAEAKPTPRAPRTVVQGGFVKKELFVGSVPIDMKEETLSEFFTTAAAGHGKVDAVRIRRPQSLAGGANPSQIAFLAMSTNEAVDHILESATLPTQRLPFFMEHNDASVEVYATRVREQAPKPNGEYRGGNRGGSRGGARGGMGGAGRGGAYQGGFEAGRGGATGGYRGGSAGAPRRAPYNGGAPRPAV